MTCNLAVWRSDFYQANGFDELYEGWGYEGPDLIIRLIHNGVRRLEGRFGVPVLHLGTNRTRATRQMKTTSGYCVALQIQPVYAPKKALPNI